MAKERWRKQRPGDPPPSDRPTPPSAPGARPPAPAGTGRWKDARKDKDQAERSRLNRRLVLIFSFVIVLGLIAFLISLIQPVAPRLVVLTAQYGVDSFLPPNPGATGDILAIASALGHSGGPNLAEPLTRDTMLRRAAEVAGMSSPAGWFNWGETTAIVYVNALGVAVEGKDGAAKAFLLPSDFPRPSGQGWPDSVLESHAIPIETVLEKVAACKGADNKLLVLDCVRADQIWPLGVVKNTFVAAVERKLEEQRATLQAAKVAVLFSTSGVEVAGCLASEGRGVFADFFARALAGDKDANLNGDRRIDLAELSQFVRDGVTKWSLASRLVDQTPRLEAFGASGADVAGVDLVALARDANPQLPRPFDDAAVSPVLDDLTSKWEQFYERSTKSPRPWRVRPVEWRRYESTLRRAEGYWLGGEIGLARDAVGAASFTEPPAPLGSAKEAYSIPMRALTRGSADAMNVDWLGAFEKGGSLDDAIGELNRHAKGKLDGLPVEACWVGMMNLPRGARGRGRDLKVPDEIVARGRAILLTRRVAERAAAAGGWDAPAVFTSVQGDVNDADAKRRLAEDEYFLLGDDGSLKVASLKVAFGQQESEPASDDALDRLRGVYQNAADLGEQLADGRRVRDQLLSEAPWFVRLAATAGVSAKELTPAAGRLLSDAKALDEFVADSSGLKAGAATADVLKRLADRLKGARATHAKMMRPLLSLAGELDRADLAPQSQLVWHQLNELLATPFAWDPKDARDARDDRDFLSIARSPREAARRRRAFLERIRRPVAELDKDAAKPSDALRAKGDGGADDESAREIARIVRELYGLSAAAASSSAAPSGAMLAESALLAVQATRAAPEGLDLVALAKLDSSQRPIEPGLWDADAHSASGRLQSLRSAKFLAWQADRMLADFWHGPFASASGKGSYYALAASTYLTAAQRQLDPAAEPRAVAELAPTKQRLDDLTELAGERGFQLVALDASGQPVPRELTTRDLVRLRLGFRAPALDPLAPATAALRMGFADRGVFRSQRLSSPASRPSELSVSIERDAPPPGATSELDLSFFFRGHVSQKVLVLRGVDPRTGPTVVYQAGSPPEPTIVVRADDRAGRADEQILFLVDCSNSMAKEISAQDSRRRMPQLKEVLTKFAESTRDGSVEVGLRVFGASVSGEVPPERYAAGADAWERDVLADSQLVLPMGPFRKKEFISKVDALEPFGFTPLYSSMLRTPADFTGRAPKKTLILISDGEDTFVDSGLGGKLMTALRAASGAEGATPPQILSAALAGKGLTIHLLGIGGKTQLVSLGQQLGVEPVDASTSQGLADAIFGWSVRSLMASVVASGDRTIAQRSLDPSTSRPLVFSLPAPGDYLVRLTETRPGAEARQARHDVVVAPRERRSLLYSDGKIDDDFDRMEDLPASRKKDNADGVAIRARELRRAGGGLDIELALFNVKDLNWRARGVVFAIRSPNGSVFHGLGPAPANVDEQPVPVWRFRAEQWPESQRELDLRAYWSDTPLRPTPVTRSEWEANEGQVEKTLDGKRVTLRCREDEKTRGRLAVELATPPESPDIERYSVDFGDENGKIRRIEQRYNKTERVYSAEFDFEGGKTPSQLFLVTRPNKEISLDRAVAD